MCVSFFVGDFMHEKYMELAIKEAKKALKNGDVPVGCVIVDEEGNVVTKAYNKKESSKNATFHAELIAISKTCKKMKTWHLEKYTLYTTMEPCLMCSGAIIQSRIGKICYALQNPSFGGTEYIKKHNKKVKIIDNVSRETYYKIVKNFFEEKRL